MSFIYFKLCACGWGFPASVDYTVHFRNPMGPMSEIGKHAPATVAHRRQPSIGSWVFSIELRAIPQSN
ncbi:MAG: hypothetical protein ACKVIB_03295 [Pseudomonadales bacterium]